MSPSRTVEMFMQLKLSLLIERACSQLFLVCSMFYDSMFARPVPRQSTVSLSWSGWFYPIPMRQISLEKSYIESYSKVWKVKRG